MPYMYPDLNAARDLVNAGAACVMPLGAPIGSNKGLCTKDFIQILIDEIDLPIIVDAGIGTSISGMRGNGNGSDSCYGEYSNRNSRNMSRRWLRHSRKQLKQEEVLIFQVLEESMERGASASSPLTGFLED